MRRLLLLLACSTGLLLVALATTGQEQSAPVAPERDLGAREAVRVQLRALRDNDRPEPDAGIRTAFRFASPENRAQTGPVERFAAMVRSDRYRPMIGHLEAEVGEPRRQGERAIVPVLLTGADGARHAYVFLLSRQGAGPCRGCWMTDGVLPHPLPRQKARPRLI